MATLRYSDQKDGTPKNLEPTKAPLYKRSYGGFTKAHEVFYLQHAGNLAGKIILDPMGGTGHALSKLAFKEGIVWLGDINPALVLLASLRDPQIIKRASELETWFRDWIKPLKPALNDESQLEYIEDWIAPSIRYDLRTYVDMLGIGQLSNPFLYESGFWTAPIEARFAACLPILAARELTCFRGSDNVTWLKRGGLVREKHIYEPVMRALKQWRYYAEDTCAKNAENYTAWGSISAQRMNVELNCLGSCPMADVVITSPPYANRLDYTNMWAPELEVLSAMWGNNSIQMKGEQLGSTVIRGRTTSLEEETSLPRVVIEALNEIRKDTSWRSDTYYYPFFRNYAVALSRSLKNIAGHLKSGGMFIIFARDTVRKDVLFPTGELIKGVLSSVGVNEVGRDKKIYKEHIGLLRKSSSRGLYGLAQQEWWLAFRKD